MIHLPAVGSNFSQAETLPADGAEETLFDFTDEESVKSWYVVNDSVMGGVSNSKVNKSEENTLRFTGTVSLENNGGFASMRTRPGDYDLGGFRGIQIRVRGDGNKYKFRIKTDSGFDGSRRWSCLSPSRGQRSPGTIILKVL